MNKLIDTLKSFISNHWLLLVEATIVIFQSGIDGRYIRSFYPPGFLGSLFGYGLNLSVDIASGVLGYEFTRHQQNARKSERRTKRLAWILLIGEFGLLYFALVFSHRQLELSRPGEPPHLLWSLAAFAPSACFLVGVAQALRDGQFTKEKIKQVKQVKQPKIQVVSSVVPELLPEPIPESIPEPVVIAPPPLQFSCQYCSASYDSVKKLNGHMKKHPVASRSNGSSHNTTNGNTTGQESHYGQ